MRCYIQADGNRTVFISRRGGATAELGRRGEEGWGAREATVLAEKLLRGRFRDSRSLSQLCQLQIVGFAQLSGGGT